MSFLKFAAPIPISVAAVECLCLSHPVNLSYLIILVTLIPLS